MTHQPRVLAVAGPDLDDYLDDGGYGGLSDYSERGVPALHQEVAAAGLRGRGGSWQPLAGKWRHALIREGGPRYVVANGAAARPGNRSDHELLIRAPHLVVEGAILSGLAVDTDELFFYVGPADAVEAIKRAVGEAAEEGFLNGELVEVVEAPGNYLAGQETSAVEYIEHHEAEPRWTPPETTVWGIDGKATVVSNVETLAHLALVANYGAGWFRQLGTPEFPGTMLLTIPAGFATAGVQEVALGTPLPELLVSADQAVRAVQLGGPGSAWLAGDDLNVLLEPDDVGRRGSRLAGGALAVMWENDCAVDAAAATAFFFAAEACRKCPPCKAGSLALAAALAGPALDAAALDDAVDLAGAAAGRGACEIGDILTPAVLSARRLFPEDFADHAAGRPCGRRHGVSRG